MEQTALEYIASISCVSLHETESDAVRALIQSHKRLRDANAARYEKMRNRSRLKASILALLGE